MDKLNRALRGERPSPSTYEPLEASITSASGLLESSISRKRFFWIEYGIFVLLGMAMLWAWNMFLAAAPYFQARFAGNEWLLAHFQPSILTVSTVTNLGVMIVLTKMQRKANYPRRIFAALWINLITFSLLAISTISFRGASAESYFVFVLLTVLLSATSSSLFQNGLFAFVSGFGQPDYTQGIMTGQGVAGILPPIVQIVSVLSVPEKASRDTEAGESFKSAFAYFLTATSISVATALAFWYLSHRHPDQGVVKAVIERAEDEEETEDHDSKEVGLVELFFKLRWFSLGVFTIFTVTMFFPVFTQAIVSVQPSDTAPRLFKPECFIPLGFLFWNAGDLIGRVLPSIPYFSRATLYPKQVFFASVARLIWIPLYFLCNVNGKGAAISSDLFYLVVVQICFGVTSGFLGSICMMAAPEWVEDREKEAAGGFMSLMLVGGLTVGSILSFGVARI